jgi:precorrin-6B C5,15-methyltransferase / cobalt-precorrin-6B C5,C15-methyltransferase
MELNPITSSPPILVVGMSAGGAESLPTPLRQRIAAADLLVGGTRHLGYFPNGPHERLAITANIDAVVVRLRRALDLGEHAVVLASGDPLCYGIGATLRRFIPAEALEVVPAPTAFQLAFAALAEPWHDAALLSAHARPLDEVVRGVLATPKAAILTDSQHTPAAIARALLDAGLPPDTPCAICENLGGLEQRILRTNLMCAAETTYAELNVFVVWHEPATKETRADQKGSSDYRHDTHFSILHPQFSIPAGLPDDAFSTSAGQITKREVRLLSLAELALAPGEVLWDIGAGSGSVAIEAARAQPAARVLAVERRAAMAEHMRENLRRFPAPNLVLVEGSAPAACHGWSDPHAVFVGGSGGHLAAIVALAQQRLRPGGRLVINLATLDHLHETRQLLPDARVVQAQISRGVPIQGMLRLEALNPVFIVCWRKVPKDQVVGRG